MIRIFSRYWAVPAVVSLLVEGGLIAEGTAGAHIVFTALGDDTAGGGTEENGGVTPLPGAWGGLFLTLVSFAIATKNQDVGSRGAAYGIPGMTLDGNDVEAVYQAAGQAIRRARDGGGR